jgi:hypothetical protein
MSRLELAYHLERAWRWLVLLASILTCAAVACIAGLTVITALMQVLAADAMAAPADCAKPLPPIAKRQVSKPKPKQVCTCTPASKAKARPKPAPKPAARAAPPAPPVCPDPPPPVELRLDTPSGGSGTGPNLRAVPFTLLPEPPMPPVAVAPPVALAALQPEPETPSMAVETLRGAPLLAAFPAPVIASPVVLVPVVVPEVPEPPPWSLVALGLIAILIYRSIRNAAR